MPTYDYICDACQHEFEAYESIKADSQTVCPTCHEPKLRRKIGAGPPSSSRGPASTRPTTGASPTRRAPRPTRPPRSPPSPPSRRPPPRPRPTESPKPSTNGSLDMIRGKCPICGKAFEVASIDDLPGVPLLLRPLQADRPRPMDRRRLRHPRRPPGRRPRTSPCPGARGRRGRRHRIGRPSRIDERIRCDGRRGLLA